MKIYQNLNLINLLVELILLPLYPIFTALPFTRRDRDWEDLTETVTRMDGAVRRIGAEPPWMGSRRVSGRYSQSLSLQLNGTALTKKIKILSQPWMLLV